MRIYQPKSGQWVSAMLLSSLIVASWISCAMTVVNTRKEYFYTVKILFHKLQDMQIKQSTDSDSALHLTKYKGSYDSELIINSLQQQSDLEIFSIKASDSFSNTWIPIILLESHVYGKAPKPTINQLKLSMDSISNFRYGNMNHSNIKMALWPHQFYTELQKPVNKPANFMKLLNITKCLHWDELSQYIHRRDTISLTHHRTISKGDNSAAPADFTSMFINIGLGSTLRSMESFFPGGFDTWASHFGEFPSVLKFLKSHAYRPFSSVKQETNIIDAKSYFFLREFLETAEQNGKDILLIPTWMFDDGNISTPHLNTIDVTTSAHVLFGLTNMILTEMVSYNVLDDPDIEKIYRNTSSMLAFQIRSHFSDCPDVSLQQHPSEFLFYFTVARILFILRRHIRRHGLFHQALAEVMIELKEALQGPCTDWIIRTAIKLGRKQVYFHEHTATKSKHTRLFSTAMAMNTLLYSWTVFDEGPGYLVWEEYTPANVMDTLERSASWLNRHILGEKYRPENELLVLKSDLVDRDHFPANACLHVNGTLSTTTDGCSYPSRGMIQGVVSEEWYKSQLLDYNTTEQCDRNNNSQRDVFVWSSKALTYGSTMLALSCYQNSIDYSEAYKSP